MIALSVIFTLLFTAGVTVNAAENKCPFEIETDADGNAVYEKNRLHIYGGTTLVRMAQASVAVRTATAATS